MAAFDPQGQYDAARFGALVQMDITRIKDARRIVSGLLNEMGYQDLADTPQIRPSEFPQAWMDTIAEWEPNLGATVGLVELLDRDELHGVLLHEIGEREFAAGHQRDVAQETREAGRLHLPGQELERRLRHLDQEKEFSCDDFAVAHGANPAKMISAIHKIAARRRQLRAERPDVYGQPTGETSHHPTDQARIARFEAARRAVSL